MLKLSIVDMSLKISNLRLQPYLPGVNELISAKSTFSPVNAPSFCDVCLGIKLSLDIDSDLFPVLNQAIT